MSEPDKFEEQFASSQNLYQLQYWGCGARTQNPGPGCSTAFQVCLPFLAHAAITIKRDMDNGNYPMPGEHSISQPAATVCINVALAGLGLSWQAGHVSPTVHWGE